MPSPPLASLHTLKIFFTFKSASSSFDFAQDCGRRLRPLPADATQSALQAGATLADLTVTSEATVSGKLLAYQATISDTFKVLGNSFLGNTVIAGDLSIDGTLTLSQNSLNSLATLYIQNSPLAKLVDFFNGLVTIDNTGLLIAQTISAQEYRAASGKSTGSGVILSGTKSIDILTSLTTATSRIFLTPTVGTTQILSVTTKVTGQKFTVTVPIIVTSNLTFDWFLVNESD